MGTHGGEGQRTANNRVTSRDDDQAGHAAVEEHIHEEFIVVEPDAVCHPGTMMIHLKNASVAL